MVDRTDLLCMTSEHVIETRSRPSQTRPPPPGWPAVHTSSGPCPRWSRPLLSPRSGGCSWRGGPPRPRPRSRVTSPRATGSSLRWRECSTSLYTAETDNIRWWSREKYLKVSHATLRHFLGTKFKVKSHSTGCWTSFMFWDCKNILLCEKLSLTWVISLSAPVPSSSLKIISGL